MTERPTLSLVLDAVNSNTFWLLVIVKSETIGLLSHPAVVINKYSVRVVAQQGRNQAGCEVYAHRVHGANHLYVLFHVKWHKRYMSGLSEAAVVAAVAFMTVDSKSTLLVVAAVLVLLSRIRLIFRYPNA